MFKEEEFENEEDFEGDDYEGFNEVEES